VGLLDPTHTGKRIYRDLTMLRCDWKQWNISGFLQPECFVALFPTSTGFSMLRGELLTTPKGTILACFDRTLMV
jgi:hypothetical protein